MFMRQIASRISAKEKLFKMNSDSHSQSALDSLNAMYTDSEGEAESDSEEFSQDKIFGPSKESTPNSMAFASVLDEKYYKEQASKSLSVLVSYSSEGPGDNVSDSDDSRSSYSDMQDETVEKVQASGAPPLSPLAFHRSLLNLKRDGIQLPVEPVGRCSKSLQEKISDLYNKKKDGKDMNASIQRRKDFRNPSIYEKLITYCNIDEQGTNYPPETYDPHCWGPESFYEELAKRQKEEMDKRERDKKERTKVEFMSGTVKKSDLSSDAGKRKSKWDVGISQMSASALKPAVLVTPNVLPVPTGTKPTVISAYGTISKKAKQ